jgi:hypothetical protein
VKRAAKRRVVVAVVLAVAIWPGFHFALAARTQFNPWELFGWAMYSLPEVRFDMGLERRDQRGVWHPFIPRGADLESYYSVGLRRANLGKLASLEPLAKVLFTRHPNWTGLAVIEQRWRLDHHTARLDHILTRSEIER